MQKNDWQKFLQTAQAQFIAHAQSCASITRKKMFEKKWLLSSFLCCVAQTIGEQTNGS